MGRADHLAAGRLVRVGQVEIEDGASWFIVWREPLLCERQDFDAFVRWLESEAVDSAHLSEFIRLLWDQLQPGTHRPPLPG